MFLRRFTDFILKNRLNAIGAAFVITLIPVIGSSISILIAILVTLRKGPYEGSLVLAATLIPFVLGVATSPASVDAQFALLATGVLIVINIVTWFLALVLRRFNNWNLVIEVAAIFGLFAVIVAHVLYPNLANWWQGHLTVYFNKSTTLLNQLEPNEAANFAKAQADFIQQARLFATGFAVASIVFNALLQLVIARWWQATMFNPGALRPELLSIKLSYILAGVLVVCSLLAFYGNSIAADLLPVLIMAFSLAGLSLLHCLVAKKRLSWLWLFLIYLGFIILFPYSAIVVSILALIDTGVDFRHFRKLNS